MKKIMLVPTSVSALLVMALFSLVFPSEVKLKDINGAANDNFGWSVAISGDYAIVGAPSDDDSGEDSGSAFIFYRSAGTWVQQDTLLGEAAGDNFGYSVSISGDSVAIVGAVGEAAAYIFRRSGNSWSREDKLTGSGLFGCSVAISGDYAIVGEYQDNLFTGAAYIFKRNGTSWTQQVKLVATDGANYDFFGYSVAISGNYAIVGAYQDDSSSGSA